MAYKDQKGSWARAEPVSSIQTLPSHSPHSVLVPPGTEELLWFLRDSIWLLNSFLTGAFSSFPGYFKMTGRTKIPFD